MKHIEYISLWSFVFEEINDQGRKLDITDRIVKTGDIIVYMELGFKNGKPKVKNGKPVPPGYTGRICVREVEQMLAPYPGLEKRFRAVVFKPSEATTEIKEKTSEMMRKLDKEGGYIPLPTSLS